MTRQGKFFRFLRFEGRLLIVTLVLILIIAGITWRTFFKTPSESEIRRDYLIEDISSHSSVKAERLEKFNATELEIISHLDLNGLIALERNPEATKRLYAELKNFQLFYDLIEQYGPHHVIPVLDYFYDEGNISLYLEDQIGQFIASLMNEKVEEDTLSERQKRLLAILSEIESQGHNFLARFIYTSDGAHRNYVSSTTSTAINFFTGGLSRFNAAVVTRGVSGVTTEELVDAGIDILVLIPFVAWVSRSSKAAAGTVRGGRILSAGKSAGAAARTGRIARITRFSRGVWRAIPLRTLFKFKYVKWYILGLVILKPDLLNHAATLVADAVSVPPIIMKTGFWFLILFPILNLLTPLYFFIRKIWRLFVRPKPAENV
ncbi:hypothetical protein JXJ21_04075 [candidate division KSB1 bacterium]|nr:hypothetical protein [candidate division KSB1 bacterium]